MFSLPTVSTIINYTQISLESSLIFIHCFSDSKKVALFTETTIFHPIDYRWKDQPADIGLMTIDNVDFKVVDCCIAAFDKLNGVIYFDSEIPVSRGAEGWVFLVAHIIDDEQGIFSKDDQQKVIHLAISREYRNSLSIAHSACHLVALAFNKISKSYWKSLSKCQIDSLGNPNLDALAIVESQIKPFQSIDTYRFGKSARKKGLDTEKLISEFQNIEREINSQLKVWLENGIEMSAYPFPSTITDVRYWQCLLPEGKAVIPCGGTHVAKFNMGDEINIKMMLKNECEIIIDTKIMSL